jgi:phosphoserine phosphatase RsbU/P
LRTWWRNQQLYVFIAVVIYAVSWILQAHMSFSTILIFTLCLGNILNWPMQFLGGWYGGLRPPWNWVVFLPMLGSLSLFGAALSTILLYWMMGFQVPYFQLLRESGPFSILVCMVVGTIRYGVEISRVRLQEKNVQLQTALNKGTDALLKQEQELDRARQIQQELLPRTIPQLPGMQVAGLWQPASTVSGDYYDVIPLGDHKLGICIGDVVGKGISAALLMANLQASFRAFATPDASPAWVCAKLNAFLCSNVASGKLISFFYCIVDGRERTLLYENAGHCPAQLLRRSGETLTLSGNGAVMGVLPEWKYKDSQVKLESGDRLLLFTDGVTEAEDAEDNEFGEVRVVHTAQSVRSGDADEIQHAVMRSVSEFCGGIFRDDATIVVMAVQ